MEQDQPAGLEIALDATERDADAVVKAAQSAVSLAKKLQKAARTGSLRQLPRIIDDAEQAASSSQSGRRNHPPRISPVGAPPKAASDTPSRALWTHTRCSASS